MAHASAASSRDLQQHATGWPALADTAAWQRVVAAVRRVLRDTPSLHAALAAAGASANAHAAAAADDDAGGDGGDDGDGPHCDGGNASGSGSGEGRGPELTWPSLYGWLSVHQGSEGGQPSSHAPHAHLDARFAAVYYAAAPPGANHAITFFDPRGGHTNPPRVLLRLLLRFFCSSSSFCSASWMPLVVCL
jgi:hypothetical protein